MKNDILDEIPHLRAYARSLCRDPVAADDLVQESLTKALANADKFRPGTNLRAWLFTILRNSFISDRRKVTRELPLPENAEELFQGRPGNQEDTLALSETVRALHTLPRDFREALLLVGATGLKYEEVASILDCRTGTVKSRVSRARAILRDRLEKGEELPSAYEARSTLRELRSALRAAG